MCPNDSECGEDVWNKTDEAEVIEVRPAEEDPAGLKVLERLAKKQRFRVGPFEPHASGRWPVREVLDRVRRGGPAQEPGGPAAPEGRRRTPPNKETPPRAPRTPASP